MAENNNTPDNKKIIVIRIRGRVNIRNKIEDTLGMIRLHRINHASIIDNRKPYLGMLQKIKDYATWGEINKETLELLLKQKGKLEGGKKLTDEFLQKYTNYKSIEKLADAIIKNEINLKDIKKVKPIFRLHPPKGGHKGKIKRAYTAGGVLGNRKEEINNLILKMI